MTTDEEILEALEASQAKAIEISQGWGSHGTLAPEERAKYRAYVESKQAHPLDSNAQRHQAHGRALLEACRVDPVSDEGHESYEEWRQEHPGYEGHGALKLIRQWRATRRAKR